MLCLDTNVVIVFMNRRKAQIVERLEAAIAAQTHIAISTIVLHELEFGIAGSDRREKSAAALAKFLSAEFEVLAFDAEDAREAGEIRAGLKRAGTPIGAFDVLIAAQARRRGAQLATLNAREFSRVPGLLVANWA